MQYILKLQQVKRFAIQQKMEKSKGQNKEFRNRLKYPQSLAYDKGDISNWVKREVKNSKYELEQLANHLKKY